MKKPVLVALAVIPFVVGLAWVLMSNPTPKKASTAQAEGTAEVLPSTGWSTGASGKGSSGSSGFHYDRKKTAELRKAILAALQSDAQPATGASAEQPRAPKPGPETPSPPAAGSGDLTMSPYAKSIRDRMKDDLIPMAASCYKNLLAKRPDAGGKIVLEFEIIHDEKLGGVVNEAALGDAGTLADDELTTCITESLSGVYFESPPGRGKVTVKYPVELSPDEPDAD
jgi:hypothetical protein